MSTIVNNTDYDVTIGVYKLGPRGSKDNVKLTPEIIAAAVKPNPAISIVGYEAGETSSGISDYINNMGGTGLSATSGVKTLPALTVTDPADLAAVGAQLTIIRTLFNTAFAELTAAKDDISKLQERTNELLDASNLA